jgi:flagellar L-ring protein FlgH
MSGLTMPGWHSFGTLIARRCIQAALVAIWLATGTAAQAVSLYNEETFRPLTADNKAFRVGDVLTIQVFENSSATTSADTGTRRKNGISAEASNGVHKSNQIGLAVGGDFEGGGRTQRANRVLATLTVTVRDILPNGDLKVGGEQQLTVNDEPQKVTLEGRVRTVDISEANVVLSTRLADAKITFIGEGDVTERSQRPWWRKLLDGMGL